MDSTTASLEVASHKATRLNEAISRMLQQEEDSRQALQAELKEQQEQLRKVKLAVERVRRKAKQQSLSLHQQAAQLALRQEQLELNIQRLSLNLSRKLEPHATSGDFSQVDIQQEKSETPPALSTSSTVPETDTPE
ncbi:hypothetical protein [Oleidesulfovibrio sp.]|uniref:hypothetical protein n=1 Tax=Oleidesulfovibrio sp. TaxID=2909707 RepID=UPI003A86FA6A